MCGQLVQAGAGTAGIQAHGIAHEEQHFAHTMSGFGRELVVQAAESSNMPPPPDDVAQVIASDLEYRFKDIIQVFFCRIVHLKCCSSLTNVVLSYCRRP